jgi:hypothetical protein
MKATRVCAVLVALSFPFSAVVFGQGCGNKDDDAPKKKEEPSATAAATPAPAPTPTPTPTQTLTVEEDAGSDQKLFYTAMIAACNAAKGSPDARAALAKVRAAAAGAKVPAGCY